MQSKKITYNSGQAALIVSIFFALISIVIVGSASALGYWQLKGAAELIYSKQAYADVESQVDILGSNTIKDAEAQIAAGQVPGPINTKVTGTANNRFRSVSISATFEKCRGLVFKEGVQAGFLGAMLNNGSTIKHSQTDQPGNLFSNGHVRRNGGGSEPYISGYAYVARSTYPNPVPDISSCPRSIADEYKQAAQKDTNSISLTSGTVVSRPFYSPITGYITHVRLFPLSNTGSIRVSIKKGSATIVSENYTLSGSSIEIDMPSSGIVNQDEQYTLEVKNTSGTLQPPQSFSAGQYTPNRICIPPPSSDPLQVACSGTYTDVSNGLAFEVYFGVSRISLSGSSCKEYAPTLENMRVGGLPDSIDGTVGYSVLANKISNIKTGLGGIGYWLMNYNDPSVAATSSNGVETCQPNSSSPRCFLRSTDETRRAPNPILLGVKQGQEEDTWQKTVWDYTKNAQEGGTVTSLPALSGNIAFVPMKIDGNLTISDNTKLFLLGHIPQGISGNGPTTCVSTAGSSINCTDLGLDVGTKIYHPPTPSYKGDRCPTAVRMQDNSTPPKKCPIVYVTGTGSFTGNNGVQIISPGGPGAMIFDGSVLVGNGPASDNIRFNGNNPIYLISTANATAEPSISAAGTINIADRSGGNVIVFAPKGVARIDSASNISDVRALSGAGVVVAGTSNVRYSSSAGDGMIPIGAAGSFFNIINYREVE